ncbi:MAG: hypothetical protein KDK51_02985 [Deltaproteobacteria bacterium]|nr:hypothetical protein [Deltaproteobacteria bacterium]
MMIREIKTILLLLCCFTTTTVWAQAQPSDQETFEVDILSIALNMQKRALPANFSEFSGTWELTHSISRADDDQKDLIFSHPMDQTSWRQSTWYIVDFSHQTLHHYDYKQSNADPNQIEIFRLNTYGGLPMLKTSMNLIPKKTSDTQGLIKVAIPSLAGTYSKSNAHPNHAIEHTIDNHSKGSCILFGKGKQYMLCQSQPNRWDQATWFDPNQWKIAPQNFKVFRKIKPKTSFS